jgi:hypothetical protein
VPIEYELMNLMMKGTSAPALSQWLLNTLTEQSLRRIKKNMDASCTELLKLITAHLQRAAELLFFRVSEIEAMAQWYERFGVIGLDAQRVSLLLQAAAQVTSTDCEYTTYLLLQLVSKSEEIMSVVHEMAADYENFFNWLLKSIIILHFVVHLIDMCDSAAPTLRV